MLNQATQGKYRKRQDMKNMKMIQSRVVSLLFPIKHHAQTYRHCSL